MECKWCFKILSKGAILLQHPLINDIVSSAADDMNLWEVALIHVRLNRHDRNSAYRKIFYI